MARNSYKRFSILTLLAYAALLLFANFLFVSRVNDLETAEIAEREGVMFGGNVWVTWENTDDGVVARRVHPLVKSNPLLEGRYIREGDILRRIDYQDIYKSEVAENIVYHAAPGTVFLFQVERSRSGTGAPEWQNIFIESSFHPRYSFTQHLTLWSLFPWVVILGGFLALISMLIIFPIIRPSMRTNWPLFAVIVASFVVFMIMGVRHLNLLVRTEYAQVTFEQWFTLLFSIMLPLLGVIAFYARLRKQLKWTIFLSLAGLGLLGYFAWNLIFVRQFSYYGDLLEDFVLLNFLLHVLTLLLVSVFQLWNGRSQLDKTFHVLALLYIGPLLAIYQAEHAGRGGIPRPGAFSHFMEYGAILIPMINAAASQLKFGRVSVVLTGSLQYILFSAVCLILYFFLHEALIYFGISIKYQAYLELSILIVLVVLLRTVYRLYDSRLRKYFILAQQEKRDQIDRFIAQIPQYSSSQKLMEDMVSAMKSYFGTDMVTIHMAGESPIGNQDEIPDGMLTELYNQMRELEVYWARNRQMALASLPGDLDEALKATPYALANPITVNEHIYGMLLLGRKRRGVFNLDDLEIISRIVQQTQLTLGVLHLLEREKILIQKNLEANLTALRSQINPHFLFNTLNTISALVHEDPDDAEIAVEKLAFIFRYTLKHSDRTFVTVKEEMSLVRTYLEIEKIRFGERLQLHFDIEREMQDVELPAFVMQTIVENCIKHGIAKITGQGVVSIEIFRKNDYMTCEIVDNGPGIDLNKITTSTGLNNIITRLEKIYELKNLLYFENTGNGTKVTIKIPLKNE
ncbi:MAG: histidine kinase [Bacteroidota bacterium]